MGKLDVIISGEIGVINVWGNKQTEVLLNKDYLNFGELDGDGNSYSVFRDYFRVYSKHIRYDINEGDINEYSMERINNWRKYLTENNIPFKEKEKTHKGYDIKVTSFLINKIDLNVEAMS